MELKYFKDSDFRCRCGQCDETCKEDFCYRLDMARGFSEVPYRLSSPARCAYWNNHEDGSSTSSHLKGIAADIKFRNSHEKFRIIYGLIRAGFKRIGINDDDSFIHVDYDLDKPQDVLFKY